MKTRNPKRLAIIGAGPIGLEAAIYARALGHDPVIYERGQVAEHVASWGFVRLFSPWSMNITTLGRKTLVERNRWTEPPAGCPTGQELREQYLLPLAEALGDAVRTGTQVIAVGKDDFSKSDAVGTADRAASPFRILIRNSDGIERIEHADVLLDCSGTYGRHRWAGRGGVPAPGERELESRIWYTIPDVLGRDRSRFANRHTLLMGSGHSAATVLHDFNEFARTNPRTKLTWAVRRPGQGLEAIADDPLPTRRALVATSRELRHHPPEWLQFLGTCVLESIRASDQFEVTLKYMATDLVLAVDEVVAMVGYRPDDSIYEQLQVHQCYATSGPMNLAAALLAEGGTDCLSTGRDLKMDVLKNPEPSFYILGAKSYGTNNNFLMRVGHAQVRDVFRLIESDPTLDLYSTRIR